MIGLDANVLLRYFAQDEPAQAALANRLIEKTLTAERPGHVCLVTLAELVWVLRRRFQASRDFVVAALSRLLSDSRFVVQDHDAAWSALDLYRRSGVDYADALVAALNRRHGCTNTVTFDKAAARDIGMTLLTRP